VPRKKPTGIPVVHLLGTEDFYRLLRFPRGTDPAVIEALKAEQLRINQAQIARSGDAREKVKLSHAARAKNREGDDGRSLPETVADAVRGQVRGLNPNELLQHVSSAITANGLKLPSDTTIKELIRKTRKKLEKARTKRP